MPFSRYQIRNEFSLADPELYKAADKDDPEALLEGVAMAGLVGVLRQLGDLAEFAAEIFHGLHEEVMVTATRGHGLLVRVQQLESDFPAIERAFLSQTSHSAFFSGSGIGWHPNLQTEQNLITRGDLPRFVMDSYEESRGPPRLFLLDKFDIAGAGACLKRYTDPSFYKVEASSFEMRNTEAQRGKNIRKTKKKGSKWKNGETPDVFQPSHVKLHQLLLEERMQNGTSEPTRHVKLKKREIKFPFDTETGKGYMETLLTSPPEDKLVHEVPVRPVLETHDEGNIVNSPSQNGSPFESPSVDKTVSMEHMNNNMPGIMIPELPENETEGNSRIEEEEVEEKHISVEGNHKLDDVSPDGYQSDDVVSEGENYVDALATMESEIETETELRTNSDANLEQIQSQFSDSQSGYEIENGLIRKKMETFSDSEASTTSTDNTPRSVTFASTEIPFRPRILPSQVSDEGVVLEESGSKESGLSEMSSSNQIDPEAIAASAIDDPSSSNHQSEDCNSNSTLEISQVEEQQPSGPTPSLEEVENYDADVEVKGKPSEEISFLPDTCSLLKEELTDDVVESKSDRDSDEIESKDDSNSDNNNNNNNSNNNNLPILEDEKESVNNSVTNPDDNESKSLSTCEDTELDERKVESFNSEIEALTFADEKDEDADDDGVSGENGPVIDDSDESVGKQEPVITPELDSIPSESGEKKELDVSTELDSVPSAAYDHSNIQSLDSIPTNENLNENLIVLEKTVENGDVVIQPDLDFESNQDAVESKSTNNKSSCLENGQEFQEPVYEEPSMEDLPQLGSENKISDEVNFNYPLAPVFTELNMLPPLSPPINLEEMPPLPPLPPMQWRIGKLPNNDDQQQNHFPPPFPQNEITENPNSQHDNHQDTEISTSTFTSTSTSTSHTEQTKVAEEQIVILPKPPIDVEEQQSQNISTSGQESLRQSSVSLIHEGDDDERPNGIGIRPMKVQRPRTPLIDAVAAHDKSKLRKVSERAKPEIQEEERDTLLPLRKVSERARPQIPKEEERDTLLEQIRAKSFNLKPAVQTRPIIQGPSTNLRVAAILEKANAIRHAFAGSDEDEDDDDSWSE
ncbi:unnamed protein product [Lactuca saligna]|uniref:Protein SCAR n=1 Tax=Lactuca saligna TaxID=75948 RepID=A0AA36EMP4_LACSI|nr:unnamed protein product [Lactuca saligna]